MRIPLSAFTADQLQALAYVFVRLNAYAFNLYLVFFGVWCVLNGYLIFRSTFLPRIFGVLLMIDGLGWMTYLSRRSVSPCFVIAVASGLASCRCRLAARVRRECSAVKEQASAGMPSHRIEYAQSALCF